MLSNGAFEFRFVVVIALAASKLMIVVGADWMSALRLSAKHSFFAASAMSGFGWIDWKNWIGVPTRTRFVTTRTHRVFALSVYRYDSWKYAYLFTRIESHMQISAPYARSP